MTDPWVDIRRLFPTFEGQSTTGSAIRCLLADADALLAVVRADLSRAMDDWESAARPTPGSAHDAVLSDVGTFDEWLELNEPALAALPEHLKEEE